MRHRGISTVCVSLVCVCVHVCVLKIEINDTVGHRYSCVFLWLNGAYFYDIIT